MGEQFRVFPALLKRKRFSLAMLCIRSRCHRSTTTTGRRTPSSPTLLARHTHTLAVLLSLRVDACMVIDLQAVGRDDRRQRAGARDGVREGRQEERGGAHQDRERQGVCL